MRAQVHRVLMDHCAIHALHLRSVGRLREQLESSVHGHGLFEVMCTHVMCMCVCMNWSQVCAVCVRVFC